MNSGIVYVSFVRHINWDTVNPLLSACNQAVNGGARQLHLLISSPGGQVDPGFAVYNQLVSLPIEIITHNISCVDSMATIVFLAGSKRRACVNATFLFHGIKWGIPSATELSTTQLIEITSSMQGAEAKMRDVIVSRSTLTSGEVDLFYTQGASKNADFALSKGLIHTVEDVRIPQGVNVIQV
jgi:ATP-dependent Clp protease, protease subunit